MQRLDFAHAPIIAANAQFAVTNEGITMTTEIKKVDFNTVTASELDTMVLNTETLKEFGKVAANYGEKYDDVTYGTARRLGPVALVIFTRWVERQKEARELTKADVPTDMVTFAAEELRMTAGSGNAVIKKDATGVYPTNKELKTRGNLYSKGFVGLNYLLAVGRKMEAESTEAKALKDEKARRKVNLEKAGKTPEEVQAALAKVTLATIKATKDAKVRPQKASEKVATITTAITGAAAILSGPKAPKSEEKLRDFIFKQVVGQVFKAIGQPLVEKVTKKKVVTSAQGVAKFEKVDSVTLYGKVVKSLAEATEVEVEEEVEA